MTALEALSSKVVPVGDLVARFSRPRAERVVFTNGCFDVLHRGHVEYLARASDAGDLLIVGLNSDASVRRLKGPGRPVNSQDDRALVLAALASVDFVTIFDHDTPLELIRALLPDVLIKGGDYRPQDIVGGREVTASGGIVIIAPLVPGRSTSDVLLRLKSEQER
ncbi:MAG TPA: D-glycero-beta-D-manno-heptose 1-phosphate adenylyltransferase [Longimicrobiaceae bacterium]|nr:D-glycero-beta-D-manno-heptose 1-phosphate adenylyltransferase [Longimicrobiaceae bacterium]